MGLSITRVNHSVERMDCGGGDSGSPRIATEQMRNDGHGKGEKWPTMNVILK